MIHFRLSFGYNKYESHVNGTVVTHVIVDTAVTKPLGVIKAEKDFNDDHRKEITDFVQSIPGFQECGEKYAETWMACDAEDCGFQMINNEEIVTSVPEESNPVDDETDEDEDNNNESSKEGRERVEAEDRSGRPSASMTKQNVSRVKNLLNNNRKMSIRMIADEMSIPQHQEFETVTEHLATRKSVDLIADKKRLWSVELIKLKSCKNIV
ncbi:UNVERIFIED_CONTAM: hypothetical protein NCL1_36332 [Trichonephila clavipes]